MAQRPGSLRRFRGNQSPRVLAALLAGSRFCACARTSRRIRGLGLRLRLHRREPGAERADSEARGADGGADGLRLRPDRARGASWRGVLRTRPSGRRLCPALSRALNRTRRAGGDRFPARRARRRRRRADGGDQTALRPGRDRRRTVSLASHRPPRPARLGGILFRRGRRGGLSRDRSLGLPCLRRRRDADGRRHLRSDPGQSRGAVRRVPAGCCFCSSACWSFSSPARRSTNPGSPCRRWRGSAPSAPI